MNYEAIQKKALAKIKQYGKAITLTRITEGEYVPEDNSYSETKTIIDGVALQGSFSLQNVDGTNIRFGDVRFMAVLSDVPAVDDEIIFGSNFYHVVNISKLSPDGATDIYYEIQAR